jgi:hypothetical protein
MRRESSEKRPKQLPCGGSRREIRREPGGGSRLFFAGLKVLLQAADRSYELLVGD